MLFQLGPMLEGVIRLTQGFGWRPDYYKRFGLPGHEGIDMVGSGRHTLAGADGVVTEIGWRRPGHPYGYAVRVQHNVGDRVYRTVYAHGRENSEVVKVGYHVIAGQPLIEWDSTGNVQGAHLHVTLTLDGATAKKFTTWPFDIIDPTPFLRGNAPETIFPYQVKVIAHDGLKVRSGPGLGYPRIGLLAVDTVERVDEALMVDNLVWGRIGVNEWIALLYTERVP